MLRSKNQTKKLNGQINLFRDETFNCAIFQGWEGENFYWHWLHVRETRRHATQTRPSLGCRTEKLSRRAGKTNWRPRSARRFFDADSCLSRRGGARRRDAHHLWYRRRRRTVRTDVLVHFFINAALDFSSVYHELKNTNQFVYYQRFAIFFYPRKIGLL